MASSARWGLTGFVPSADVVGLCFRLQAQKHRDKTANMYASPRRPTATRDRLIRTLHLSAVILRADRPMSLPARSQCSFIIVILKDCFSLRVFAIFLSSYSAGISGILSVEGGPLGFGIRKV